MGIFDIFSSGDATNAAQAQIAGLNAANTQATGNINSGINALQTNYTSALAPFLTNYNQAQGGVTQLQNLLGLNGASGNQAALTALQATPGYQFNLQQGNNAITAQNAATGKTGSGNEAIALANYNQGLAGTTYQNAVQNLMPFLQSSNSNAAGIGGLYSGLGNATANQYNTLAGLNWNTQTGIGNANANADLAGLTASGNILGAIGALGGAALGAAGLGGLGGVSSFLSPGSSIPGSIGPTSVGGANGPTPLSGGSIFGSIFSDERLKEDISKVGELYDGQNVYSYRYKGDPTSYIGLMAQEVEQYAPDAVTEISGFKAVDYGKATSVARDLSRFMDDNVVSLDDRGAAPKSGVDALQRFLEAA